MAHQIDRTLERAARDTFWMPEDVSEVVRADVHYVAHPEPIANFNRVLFSRGGAGAHRALAEEVSRAHIHGVSTWILNPMNDSEGVRRVLRDFGYEQGYRHNAYALACDDFSGTTPSDVEVSEVSSIEELLLLYELDNQGFENDHGPGTTQLQKELALCTGTGRRVMRFIAYRRGEPAGSAGLTFFDDLDFGLLWAGSVVPAHRGNGVYTALLARRAEAALERGVSIFGLHARVDTSASIVAAKGFQCHGHMDHFVRH